MQVALNNAGTMTFTSGASSSGSFSVTAGALNLCAFAVVAWDNTASKVITAITYGGVTMASCGAASNNSTGNEYVQMFYLTTKGGLLTGSNTLSVTATAGTNELYVNLVSFKGVHQDTPVMVGTYQTTTASAKTCSLTIVSAIEGLTVSAMNGGTGTLPTTNQTLDGSLGSGSYSGGSDHCTTRATSVTHTWTTASTTTNYAMLGFGIQPAPITDWPYPNNLNSMTAGPSYAI